MSKLYFFYHYYDMEDVKGAIVMKLVLLRHGESVWNKENRFSGWTGVDLTETVIWRPAAVNG